MKRAGRTFQRLGRFVPTVVLLVVLIGAWQVMALLNDQPGTLWPSPLTVAGALWEGRSRFLTNARVTMGAAGLGFLGGVILGCLFAVLSVRLRVLGENLYRISLALYSLPLIALAPVLTIWLGIGLATKVVIALLASFFPIVVNVTQALRTTEPRALELMTVLGASSRDRFQLVELPYALPALFAACKVAGPNAIIGAMLAEWVGAERGLGIQLLFTMFNYQVPRLWATLLVATALTVGTYYLFDATGKRLFPWHASEQTDGVV